MVAPYVLLTYTGLFVTHEKKYKNLHATNIVLIFVQIKV
jgi:hypothetical protein